MLSSLIIFIVTTVLSFVCTIQPGPLSIFVIQTTLRRNSVLALWVATGGALAEGIYVYLALNGATLFDHYPTVTYWMQWIIVVLLLVMGVTTFRQPPPTFATVATNVQARAVAFFKGGGLTLINPQILPFWVVVILGFQNYTMLKFEGRLDQAAFFFGAVSGTWLLMFSYIMITRQRHELILKYISDRRINLLTGLTFIGLALLQLGQIVLR